MNLLITAMTALTFVADAKTTEGPKSAIAYHQESRCLQDEPFEIAAIASGFPMQSSSDWSIGSTAPRAIMTKEYRTRPNYEPPYYMHWCAAFAD